MTEKIKNIDKEKSKINDNSENINNETEEDSKSSDLLLEEIRINNLKLIMEN